MSFWYLPPKNNQAHALVGTREWSTCNTKFHFSEAIAREVDDYWYLFMQVTDVKPNEIKNIGDNSKDWEFKPQLCLLRFAKKDLVKKEKEVPQSLPEKFFCKILSELEQDKHYSGFILIQDSPQMQCLVDGSGKIGDTVFPAEYLKAFQDSFCKFEPTESKEIPDNIMDSIGGKSGFTSGKRGETEAEKLNARLGFILEQYKLAFEEIEAKCLSDIFELMTCEQPDKQTKAGELWNLAIQLIGK